MFKILQVSFQQYVNCELSDVQAGFRKGRGTRVPGASVRNPTHGKGHEEGGSAYAKAGSSLRRPPVPEHLPPKTRVCLLYCVMLSTYSSDINRGLSPHHLFLES